MNGNFERLEFENGDAAYGLKLPIPPHGDGYVVASDATESSKALLVDIQNSWPDLWPKMVSYIEEASNDYDVEIEFDSTFMATVQKLDEDVFMGDEADVMIGIHPCDNAVPVWHFFVRGLEIVHSQPVF